MDCRVFYHLGPPVQCRICLYECSIWLRIISIISINFLQAITVFLELFHERMYFLNEFQKNTFQTVIRNTKFSATNALTQKKYNGRKRKADELLEEKRKHFIGNCFEFQHALRYSHDQKFWNGYLVFNLDKMFRTTAFSMLLRRN